MECQLILREGGIDYVLLTKDRLEDALRIQANTMVHENIAIGLGMFEEPGAPEEMQLIFKEVVKDGISIIALDSDTKEMAGVVFNKMHIPLKEGDEDALGRYVNKNIKHRSCIELIRFLNNFESKVNIFEKYDTDAILEMFYIATDKKYRRRGIGLGLTKSSFALGKMLQKGEIKKVSMGGEIVLENAIPNIAIAIYSSNYSIRIGEKLRGECLAELLYEDYTFNGKKMSERIDSNHKRVTLIAFKL
ncbi:PREDICTED: uncharacterized protein LOC106791019 isoform X1 [Polistes canadensis]|uniref:uncharacterized protein LOC106791019 isoform X1 n=1 Tax=Polistes canadensis TaxID=91411 RepID=UPI000718B5E3|nr:PREDICTED: uncharacterized protein LOC106791019 isoform X1 [Polistes canadensis]